MKIEYLHKLGGMVHQGPTGTVYAFVGDHAGRRVAEVGHGEDQARFLSLRDALGRPLFAVVDEPPRPARARAKPTEPVEPAVIHDGEVT